MLRVGKHRGRTFEEVAQADRDYCAWVLREELIGQGLKKFRAYLQNNHGGVMSCGKHKGRYFDEIIGEAPGYAEWARALSTPSAALKGFVEYIGGSFTELEHDARPHGAWR